MIFKVLLKYFFGYVRIAVEGYYIERFINICTNSKILIWNLKREKGVKLYLNIGIQDYYKAVKVAKKLQCKIKIVKKRGVPFIINKYRKRKVFVVSLLIIIIALCVSSNYIWNIEIQIEDINTGNCYIYIINSGKAERKYIDLNDVAILAKVDMNKNTIITKDMIVQSNAVVTDDVRVEEYNMISLPADLATDDYIDIRIMFPNGENFIVVSKRQVDIPKNDDGTYISDTIRVQLNEEEILAMSSAIVEAYGVNGTKIYANKYAEPGIQSPALPTYTPNSAVTALIEADANILDKASEGLRTRYSDSAKQIRNSYIQSEINKMDSEEYNQNIQEKTNTSITNSEAARKLYLETLTGTGN